jgi:2-polyprenyl-6-hydroxyphenyl methylase / 3-demethylubiquinone-9 3-methyltransferase
MPNTEEQIRMHSGDYVGDYERKPVSRIARLIPRMSFDPEGELADFACGNAMLLPLTHDRVRHYHGVDFSEDFIRVAQKRAQAHGITNCSFHCTDIVDFCRDNTGRFSIATALDFSEHIDDGDFVRIFSAIRASLHEGGRLYLHTPNLTFILELLKQRGILPQFPQHIAVRDAEHNVRLLEQCGFRAENLTVHLLPHYNVMQVVHPLRHIPGLGKFFVARLFIECRA